MPAVGLQYGNALGQMGLLAGAGTNVVEMTLSKTPSERFGFANVPTQDARALIISWIDQQGLLAAWNARNVDRAAREGDRLLFVNGVDGCEAMRAQLQLDTIRLCIQRADPA